MMESSFTHRLLDSSCHKTQHLELSQSTNLEMPSTPTFQSSSEGNFKFTSYNSHKDDNTEEQGEMRSSASLATLSGTDKMAQTRRSQDEMSTQDRQNYQYYQQEELFENKNGEQRLIIDNLSRVAANSNVNYIFLNKREEAERYKNLVKEHSELAQKVHQLEQKSFMKWEQLGRPKPLIVPTPQLQQLRDARNKLHQEQFEFDDCQCLIENLATLLKSNKMAIHSLQFKMLCALVKRVAEPDQERGQDLKQWKSEVLKSQRPISDFFRGHNPESYVTCQASSGLEPKIYKKVFNIERPLNVSFNK